MQEEHTSIGKVSGASGLRLPTIQQQPLQYHRKLSPTPQTPKATSPIAMSPSTNIMRRGMMHKMSIRGCENIGSPLIQDTPKSRFFQGPMTPNNDGIGRKSSFQSNVTADR